MGRSKEDIALDILYIDNAPVLDELKHVITDNEVVVYRIVTHSYLRLATSVDYKLLSNGIREKCTLVHSYIKSDSKPLDRQILIFRRKV